MAFCEFSNEVVSSSTTAVDNLFLAEFLPNVSGEYSKVYLYGLFKCQTSRDNTIENFSKALNMSQEDILSIFYYWQEAGLVNVINVDPIVVRYLPIRNAMSKMKKYNVDKYTSFNMAVQDLIGSKMLTPREFEEFYYLIENLKMEKDAVLKIVDYCVKLKGENVAVSYIVAVAKNWAYAGVKTCEDVDNRLQEQQRVSGDVVLLLKALGIKRAATTEEYQMYLSWANDLEIPLDIMVHIAKKTKSKNFSRLGEMIAKCYANRLLSVQEIDAYLKARDDMFSLAKVVVKNLGLWYDNLENVVDTYIVPWLGLGFENSAIEKLSNMAFRSNIRNLDGLNNNINNMFKMGLLTSENIDNYMQDIVKNDNNIANILQELGVDRSVISMDRNMYKTWEFDWQMPKDVIDYAVSLAKGKYSAMQYLNRILAEYHRLGIHDLESAKNNKLNFVSVTTSAPKENKKSASKREYTKKELESLFDEITEVEI